VKVEDVTAWGFRMSHRSKLLAVSIVVLFSASLIIATVSIFTLYNTAFDTRAGDLVHTVQSQARLMEAVARVDLAAGNQDPARVAPTTLKQFVDAHARFEGFGETGEFTLAKRDGEQIVFLLDHRHVSRTALNPFLGPLIWRNQCVGRCRAKAGSCWGSTIEA